MSAPQAPNPERRSDTAILCLSIGVGLMILAWVLGVGGVLAAALAGDNPAALAGGLAAMIALPLAFVGGAILAVTGMIWIFVLVVADARGADAKERYKNVER